MGLLALLKRLYENNRTYTYIERLNYAKECLYREPAAYEDILSLKYKKEAVQWLIDYYMFGYNHKKFSYEHKLEELVAMPDSSVCPRNHSFIKVFYHWKKHKSVDGY